VIWELKPDYFATIDSLQPNKEKAIEQANVYLEQLAENAIRAVLLK
jgi:hypothetical protein